MRALIIAAMLVGSMAAAAEAAPRCRDAKGKFIKCPAAAPAPSGRCRLKGKFVKCGTPGATPA